MTYYRVPQENNNKRIFGYDKNGNIEYKGCLVANELYTQKEVEKMRLACPTCILFDQIEISRKRTYFFFGARFEK